MRNFLALALLLLPMSVAAQQQNAFKDWLVGCDQQLRCQALGLAGDAERYATLSLARGPLGNDAVQWRFAVDGDVPAGSVLRISIDNDDAGALKKLPDGDTESPQWTTIDDDQAARLLAALRTAGAFQLRAGAEQWSISLSGASAALLWIDDQQNRLGTVGALIRRGEKPNSSVPVPPPIAPLRARIESAARALDETEAARLAEPLMGADAGDDCELFEGETAAHMAWQLTPKRQLVAVHCTSGAYNIAHRWFFIDDGEATPIDFDSPIPDDGAEPWLINSEFEPSTGSLSAFNRGRGLGDCGTISRYVYTDRGFELAEWTTMPTCQGVPWSMWLTLVERPSS
jgi:hypothetical protein